MSVIERVVIVLFIFAFYVYINYASAYSYEAIVEKHNRQGFVNKQDVRYLFSMRNLHWDNGSRVVVVLLPWNSQPHLDFVTGYLQVRPDRLRKVIEGRINSGKASRYIQVPTVVDMIRTVAGTSGAIGYADNYMLIGSGDGVRILNVR